MHIYVLTYGMVFGKSEFNEYSYIYFNLSTDLQLGL